MKRRSFLQKGGIVGTGALTALAGCTSENSPPPRRSNVVNDLSITGNNLQIRPFPADQQWVMSRRDIDLVSTGSSDGNTNGNGAANSLSGFSPVGVASAAKGRGATGRGSGGYSSAPRTHNGRAWFFGGSYANSWYDDHEDEVEKYPVTLAAIGVAYLGTNQQFQEQDPGAGPVSWDQTYDEPDPNTKIETPLVGEQGAGWYRVGAHTVIEEQALAEGEDGDLGWECIDIRVERANGSLEVTERWKVSPRV
ncbi:hypothetical protein [Haladaptatus cibarius]|uniref:hypothetical protein n=1 Tax=Haladaptatus cibarius TaxID=453847 RepID=UPI0009FBE02B|nr:hypothetical protein [Haladaptatus cibarius]